MLIFVRGSKKKFKISKILKFYVFRTQVFHSSAVVCNLNVLPGCRGTSPSFTSVWRVFSGGRSWVFSTALQRWLVSVLNETSSRNAYPADSVKRDPTAGTARISHPHCCHDADACRVQRRHIIIIINVVVISFLLFPLPFWPFCHFISFSSITSLHFLPRLKLESPVNCVKHTRLFCKNDQFTVKYRLFVMHLKYIPPRFLGTTIKRNHCV